MSRSAKERRAYQLVVVGGITATIAVVGGILAIAGVIGGGLPFIAAIVAVICIILFRRLVGTR
jgi:F0F1-type ATP synthase assembly protein I